MITTIPASAAVHPTGFIARVFMLAVFGLLIPEPPFASAQPIEWTRRAVVGPAPRYLHAMAYDSDRDVTVLFGGLTDSFNGETWEWNGRAWTRRMVIGPSPRDQHAMAYDSARNVAVLFGGYTGAGSPPFSSETWEWDGVAWSQRTVTGPVAQYGHAMAYDSVLGTTVLFGGTSGTAETWWLGVPCQVQPSITAQPVAQAVCAGSGSARFTVTAVGEAQLLYHWRKDGQSLADEPNHISGAHTATLIIVNATEADEERYRCIVSNACGSVTSDDATLTVSPADFNNDGTVNSQDFFNFLACFFNPEICSPPVTADFNGDGTITSQDFFDFLAAFFTGC